MEKVDEEQTLLDGAGTTLRGAPEDKYGWGRMLDWAWEVGSENREKVAKFGECDPSAAAPDDSVGKRLLESSEGTRAGRLADGRVIRFSPSGSGAEDADPTGRWSVEDPALILERGERLLVDYAEFRRSLTPKAKKRERVSRNMAYGAADLYLTRTTGLLLRRVRDFPEQQDRPPLPQVDFRPGLIPYPDGWLTDLATGEYRLARERDMILRTLPHSPRKGEHPVFDRFLQCLCLRRGVRRGEDIEHHRDRETERAMLEMMALPLLRRSSKWALFLHGAKNNGKSSLFSVMETLYGQLVGPIHSDWKKEGAHDAFSASISGLGLAFDDEAADAEGRTEIPADTLRRLTPGGGGANLSVREMRGNAYRVRPTWQLWLAFNTAPRLAALSAVRDRVRVLRIPYEVDVHGDRPDLPPADRELVERIGQEAPAVLHTMIEAAKRLWKSGGMVSQTPRMLSDAGVLWKDMNRLAAFLLDEWEVTGEPKDRVFLLDFHRRMREWIYEREETEPDDPKIEQYVPSLSGLGKRVAKFSSRISTEEERRMVDGKRARMTVLIGLRPRSEAEKAGAEESAPNAPIPFPGALPEKAGAGSSEPEPEKARPKAVGESAQTGEIPTPRPDAAPPKDEDFREIVLGVADEVAFPGEPGGPPISGADFDIEEAVLEESEQVDF